MKTVYNRWTQIKSICMHIWNQILNRNDCFSFQIIIIIVHEGDCTCHKSMQSVNELLQITPHWGSPPVFHHEFHSIQHETGSMSIHILIWYNYEHRIFNC